MLLLCKMKKLQFWVSPLLPRIAKKGWKYLTIPLNAVKHRYFMVSTNGEYFVKLSRILTFASVFLYFDVAQYFHIWRQTMRRQLPCALYSPLYWTSTQKYKKYKDTKNMKIQKMQKYSNKNTAASLSSLFSALFKSNSKI